LLVLGIEFFVDGLAGAKKSLAKISKDGGAAGWRRGSARAAQ
jgi:hypothetical protein